MQSNYFLLTGEDEVKKDKENSLLKISHSTKLIRQIFQDKKIQLAHDVEATQQFSIAVTKRNRSHFWYPFIGSSLVSVSLLALGSYFLATVNTDEKDAAAKKYDLLLNKYVSDIQSNGLTCEDNLEIFYYPDGPYSQIAKACSAKATAFLDGITLLQACAKILTEMCELEDHKDDDPRTGPAFGIIFCLVGFILVGALIYKYLKRNPTITLDELNTQSLSDQLQIPITNQSYRNLSHSLFSKQKGLTEEQLLFHEAREMVDFFQNYSKNLTYFDENVLLIMISYLMQLSDKNNNNNNINETRIEIMDDEPAGNFQYK